MEQEIRNIFKRATPALCLFLLLFASISFAAGGAVNLPQTGQTKCYDTAGAEIACAGTGQDGEIRAGVAWPNPRFTVDGECVTDNLTGLMWAKDANLPNGAKTWNDAIDFANDLTLCGYDDWRLPNINELESLVNAEQADYGAWLISNGFTKVQTSYWSSTTIPNYDYIGCIVAMWSGSQGNEGKQGMEGVWPVRGTTASSASVWKTGQTVSYRTGDDGYYQKGITWPTPRFTAHGNGTATDNLTGLMWTTDIYTPGPLECDPGISKGWQAALDHVKCLNIYSYAGYSDWRLPNRKEPMSLIDRSQYSPSLPLGNPFSSGLLSWSSSSGWSSTTFALEGDSGSAWLVNMWYGAVYNGSKTYYGYVWPVRLGQVGPLIISPVIAMTPMTGPPGQVFKEWGTGFTPNGTATLRFKKPDGWSMYPDRIELLDSIGHFGITYEAPYNKPAGTYLWWGIDNTTQKKSNEVSFIITGDAPVMKARIEGVVEDGKHVRIAGATVYLNNESTSRTTDSKGSFAFENVPAGDHTIWAKGSYGESEKQIVKHSGIGIVYRTLVIPGSLCNPGKTPILLVPGIMGSSTGWGVIYPTLPVGPPSYNDSAWNTKSWGLHDPICDLGGPKVGWRDLVSTLEEYGYQKDCNLFTVPYDFRMSLNTGDSTNAVQLYLVPWIQTAKLKSGMPKVNIIAHSMGGLLARSYIQSDLYKDDVDKFAMVGTPNHGAAVAYYVSEGGDTKGADETGGLFSRLGIAFYTWTMTGLYAGRYGVPLPSVPGLIRQRLVYSFTRDHIPSLRQITPTFSFLSPGGELKCERNDWLGDLNSNSHTDRMGKEDDTGRVRTKVFTGKDNDTVDNIAVNLVPGCTGTLYKDGTPVSFRSFRTSSYGDGTVLANQAKLNWVSFTDDISSSHTCLINKYRDKVLAFITGTSVGAGTLRATASTVSELTLSLSPNAQPYLTDPSGKTSGINPVSGIPEEGIPGTSMSMGSEGGYLTIENPVNGTYTVTIKDPYSEEFFVSLSYMDSTKTNEKSSWGYIYEQPYSFTFTLNSSITDTIIINYAPPIPGNLRADAVNQDGIKTRLTWNPSTDPSVNAYNVYSKELDSSHLTLITTVVTSTYTTGFPWVTDPSGKERIFAVSAVSSNGDESFLSDPVTNKNVVFLSSGWNLASLPLQPLDTGITTVLNSIEGNYSIVWAYSGQAWKLYDPSDPEGSTLKTIDAGAGYWIKTISPGSLSITGTTPPSSISLLAGWNLVGYNKTVQGPASDVLSSIAGKYTIVWAYIDGVWKLYDPSDVPGSTLKTFEPGYGYWIKTTQAVMWSQ